MNILCICSFFSSLADFFTTASNYKDYIIPLIAPILGIGGAIYVMKRQLSNNEAIENTKKTNEQQLVHQMTTLNNISAIENLRITTNNLSDLSSNLNVNNFEKAEIPQFNSTAFMSITNISFKKIFELIDTRNEDERSLFAQYWLIVSSIPDNYKSLKDNINDTYVRYNEQNENLNNINHSIALQMTLHVEREYKPPYFPALESINFPSKDPMKDLAYLSMKAIDTFRDRNNTNPFLVKMENYLLECKSFSTNEFVANAITIEFAQDVIRGLLYLNNIKILLASRTTAINSYITKFKIELEVIQSFNSLLLTKEK